MPSSMELICSFFYDSHFQTIKEIIKSFLVPNFLFHPITYLKFQIQKDPPPIDIPMYSFVIDRLTITKDCSDDDWFFPTILSFLNFILIIFSGHHNEFSPFHYFLIYISDLTYII